MLYVPCVMPGMQTPGVMKGIVALGMVSEKTWLGEMWRRQP